MLARYGFGLFPSPSYRDAAIGAWRIRRHGPAPVTGYVSGPTIEPWRHVLYQGRTAWMSTSLMEQESHAPHVHAAHGLVVVAGLGMGLFAYAVSSKPEVERLVVIERDPEVIALLHAAAAFTTWPGYRKVTILQADALALDLPVWMAAAGGSRPSYLYADIWSTLGAPEAPGQTAAMVRALQPEAAGWWGQELSFGLWCLERALEPDVPALASYAAAIGVPVSVSPGYAAFCRDVIANRLPRPPGRSFWRPWRRSNRNPTGP